MRECMERGTDQREQGTALQAPTSSPEPPYPDGSRVRCLISTDNWNDGIELRGTIGTVVHSAYFDHSLTTPFWDITVAWDNAAAQQPFHHAPEELEPAEG